MPRRGATFDENVGAALRAAIGRFNRGPEIAARDRGSHFPVSFSREQDHCDPANLGIRTKSELTHLKTLTEGKRQSGKLRYSTRLTARSMSL